MKLDGNTTVKKRYITLLKIPYRGIIIEHVNTLRGYI